MAVSLCAAATVLGSASSAASAVAHPAQAADERTISRYLLLLEKRPAGGTAFDRVFKHYDQNGRLDELITYLQQPATSDQMQSARQLLLGMVFVRNKDAKQAIEQLELAKQKRPSDPAIDDQIARAWMLQSEFAKAAAAWQAAFDQTTNRTAALELARQLASVYGRLRQGDAALAVLLKFEKQFPGEAEIQDLLTNALVDAGRSDEAVVKLKAELAKTRDPQDRLKIETRLADLMLKAGRTTEAVTAYQSMLERLNPESWQAQELDEKLQQVLAKQPDQTALEAYLVQRLKTDSTSLAKRRALMEFLGRTGRHEESLRLAMSASDSLRDSPELIRTMIADHFALKQFVQIETIFQRLESLGQLSIEDVVRWGQIALDRPDRDSDQRRADAIERWNKLLGLVTEAPEWQLRAKLASQCVSAGMAEEAASQYSQAVTSRDASADVFFLYAELLLRQSQSEKAVGVLQELVSRSAKSSARVRQAAVTLKKFEQIDAAVKFSFQLVEQDPSLDNRMLLAELLLLNDDFGSADQQLVRVMMSAGVAQQQSVRQQTVDLLLRTGFVSAKVKQLSSDAEVDDSKLLLLAQLSEVQGDLTIALQTVQRIPADSVLGISVKQMQARLQQKAGQLRDAEASFETLAVLDPKRSFEYRESIQNLQLQMGRNQDALETARASFQAVTQSASSVSRYVAFLKNSGRQSEAISVLSTFLKQQDSSAAMMVELGDLLSEQFRSAEAMNWLWRAIEKTASESLQRDIATRLVVLALRTRQTSEVLQRLKSTVNQKSSVSSAHRTLLMVDAYRQARQLSDAVLELQKFLLTESGNVAALTELVDLLSKLNRPTEALKSQFLLARLEPNLEVFKRLTELLNSQTEVRRYESELLQLARLKEWPGIALGLVDQWLESGRTEDAAIVIKTLKQSDLLDWRIATRETFAVLGVEGVEAATALAHQFVQQPVSAGDLLEISITNDLVDLYQAESVAEAHVIAGQLSINHAAGQPSRLPAMRASWQSKQQPLGTAESDPIAFAKEAILLHRANALSASDMYDAATRLALTKSANDDAAALSLVLAIEPEGSAGSQSVVEWNADTGLLASALLRRLQEDSSGLLSREIVQLVHQRLVESNLIEAAEALRQELIPQYLMDDPQQLAEYWGMAEASRDLVFANLVLDQWVERTETGNEMGSQLSLPDNFGRSLAMFSSLANTQQRFQLLKKFLLLKVGSGTTSRQSASSTTGRSFEVRWTKKTSHRLFENGRHVGSRNVVTFPETSIIEMTDITFFVNLMHGLDDSRQRQLSDLMIQAAGQQEMPRLRVLYRLASAHLLCLQSEFDDAILELIDAAETDRQMGSLRVLIAAYHAENGHAMSALNLLETIPSSDVVAYQQTLWLKLRIGSLSGQLAVADQAAKALLGTRLTREERRHLALVTKDRQLTELFSASDPVAAPRNTRPMEMLVNQMRLMQKDNQIDKAIEIANSILLTSDATQHTTSMANAARRSAVKFLAEHRQLGTALVDIDRRLTLDSNSVDLLRLKLQILNGMNRSAEAKLVQLKLAVLVPESPEEWIQMARDFEDDRRFSEAADTYLKAFRAKPSLLLADYYRYFKVFRRIDRLPEISDLMLETDLRQLRDNYFVVSELIDILLSQSDATELGQRSIDSGFQLLSAAWTAFPSDRDYLLNNIQARRLWESKLVVDFICDSLIPDSAQQAFARPWLGLDSKPVQVDGEGRLCALQRVLMYLKNDKARRNFLQRVIVGQKQFPEWLAGPYIEVALMYGTQGDGSAKQKLVTLIDLCVAGNGDQLPPEIAAINSAKILRGTDRIIDGRLAVLLEAATASRRAGTRTSVRTSFVESTEQLLAELQFSSGNLAGGRRTVLDALGSDGFGNEQILDAEAAWNLIQSVLAAVELLRSADLVLDAVTLSKQVRPRLLMDSRGFQSNDSLDRACQRMWQQSGRVIQTAGPTDVLTYLKFQIEDKVDGRISQWDLQLNPPSWSDQISWQNSDLISILQRIATAKTGDTKALVETLQTDHSDQLSASLCLLAVRSPTENSTEYLAAVQGFANKLSERVNMENGLPKNGVLVWCLVNPFRKQVVRKADSVVPSPELIQQVLKLALIAGPDHPELRVWKHSILNDAAEMLQDSGSAVGSANAWADALDNLVPPLAKQPITDRSPLKETRRLLMGP